MINIKYNLPFDHLRFNPVPSSDTFTTYYSPLRSTPIQPGPFLQYVYHVLFSPSITSGSTRSFLQYVYHVLFSPSITSGSTRSFLQYVYHVLFSSSTTSGSTRSLPPICLPRIITCKYHILHVIITCKDP